jgi:hypothetical protein
MKILDIKKWKVGNYYLTCNCGAEEPQLIETEKELKDLIEFEEDTPSVHTVYPTLKDALADIEK